MFREILDELVNNETQAYSLQKYIGDNEFENEIIEYTKKGFVESVWKSFPSQETKNLVILGLTFIALKYYDGSLWPHVCDKYSTVLQDSQLLESKIRDNVLSPLTSKYNCDRKHYQIPVINAIVPFNYASNYIEFVNDIYIKNLDCNLLNYNVEEEIENVFNAIGRHLSDADDSFKYNFEQNNTKVYKLIRATKNIIKTSIKRQELVLLTKEILKKLDNYYKGKNESISYYIDKAFNKWILENKDHEIFRTRTRSNFVKSKFPYYTYLNVNGNIYLHTPTKRLFGDYDPKLFSLEILEDNTTIIREENLKVNFLLGGIEIVQCNYLLKNPLNKIRCKIFYSNEEVYDSKDYLYRDFLLFDDNKELKNNKSYNGLVYFIYKNSCDKRLTKLKDFDFYKISYNSVVENEEYLLDEKHQICFSNIRKPGIYGDIIPSLEIIDHNNIIYVYSKIHSICMVSENLNKFANKIKINNNFIDMDQCVEILEQTNSLAYLLDVEKLDLSSNMYIFELVDIKQNKTIQKYKVVLDGSIDIQQTIGSEYSINYSYTGTYDIVDKANRNYKDFPLLINDLDKKNLYLKTNEDLYKCKFNLTIPYYQIDNGIKNIFSKYVTSEDFNSQSRLYFNVDNCDKVLLGANENIFELSIKTFEKRNYIELSELLNYKNCKVIELSFIADNLENQYLKIYNDAVFNFDESYYLVNSSSQEVEFKTIIDGKKTSDIFYLQLANRFGIISEIQIDENNNVNIFNLGNKIQKIHYCIYRNIKEFSGFKAIDKQEILHEGNFAYYPIDDLINKYLLIDKVQLQSSDEEKNLLEVKDLSLKLVKRFNKFYWLGFLYNNKQGKIFHFDKIGALLINLSQVYKEEQNWCCDAIISIFYEDSFEESSWVDYLQYDKNNKSIINGFDGNATFIEKYRINLTLGERQYAKFKSNRKS